MKDPITVVAPVFRNAENLPELVVRLHGAVPDARIILVDDACPDGSGGVVDQLAATSRRVEGLHHVANLGQQEAIRTGLRNATGTTVVLDADLQDPPEAVPRLLDLLEVAQFDAVFAGRRGFYEEPLRLATGAAFRLLLALRLGLPRDAGGFVAMSSRCVAAVLAMPGPPQLVAMIGRTGLPTTSIPVARSRRLAGYSTITAPARLRHAAAGLRHAVARTRNQR